MQRQRSRLYAVSYSTRDILVSSRDSTLPLSVLLLLLLLLACGESSASNVTFGWKQLTYLDPQPPTRVFAASSGGAPVPPPYPPWSRNGIVLFGGASSSTTFVPVFNDVWVLNPLDDEGDGRAWTQIPIIESLPAPDPRCLSAAAVDPTGVLYIFGGYDGHVWYNDFWRLNLTVIHTPGENVGWELIQAHDEWPDPVCGHTMTYDSTLGGFILFGGGYDYKQLYQTVWFGTEAGWKIENPKLPYLPPAREFHNAVVNYDSDLLIIFGGYEYGYSYLNDTWQYNITKHARWYQYEPTVAPDARANAAMIEYGLSDLVLFGGRADEGRVVFGDVWHFDGESSEWDLLSEGNDGAPKPRFGMSYGIYDTGKIIGLLVFGGEDSSGLLLNDTWVYVF
eukprot:TRINITY_DN331_c0_g1_i1.p1 TRINITY_DN331_c0_g1~~TRINITY_DN331_c0_g1_i1.p1  ORF type:complete len:393 (-),score=75.54 TRINITY_DN331_c0_g1_i1:201-1379(-)